METYDFIIAGGGCAGLSLAWYLQKEGLLKDNRLLILDRDRKEQNDRTWCFWGDEHAPFVHLAAHSWPTMRFHGPGGKVDTDLAPQAYHLIRGIDFYRFIREALKDEPHVQWEEGAIQAIRPIEQGAEVVIDGSRRRARYVFNSCVPFNPPQRHPHRPTHWLWQHFKGWRIQTPDPVFHPERGTLMDFRVPQGGETRFGYLLPCSPTEALVEFTVFSAHTWTDEQYERALRDYVGQQLNISAFSILESESGAIPMSDAVFAPQTGDRIFHIGTAGGAVKPTTGYAFQRIQDQTSALAQSLRRSGRPVAPKGTPARFRFYDSLLLHILTHEGSWGQPIFSHLFHGNSMRQIFRFLGERTNLWQEIRLFATLPLAVFLRAVWATQVRLSKPQPGPILPSRAKVVK